MSRKHNIPISLNLTHEELTQFYWIIYGTSLVEYTNIPKTNNGFLQILEQMESFFIQQNPDCIFEFDERKREIENFINKNKK